MKFTIQTAILKDALNRLSTLPGANGASPWTAGVIIDSEIEGLTLTRFSNEATLKINISEGVEGDVEKTMVGHAQLLGIVSSCDSKEITIEGDGKTISIQSGRAKSKLKVFDDDDFAEPVASDGNEAEAETKLESLSDGMSFVAQAVSDNPANGPAFQGICIRAVEGRVNFIATDKKRAHVQVTEMEAEFNAIIPKEGVDAILKLIGASKGNCALAIGQSRATIKSAELEISVGLMNETFPEVVEKFMSQVEEKAKLKIEVNRDELAKELKRCAAISDWDFGRLVDLDIGKKEIKIFGSNKKDSETATSVSCKTSGTANFGVAALQLAQGINAIQTEENGILELLWLPESAIVARDKSRQFFSALMKPQFSAK